MGLTLRGLLCMQIDETYKAYLGVCWLYLVTSASTLVKTLRDSHEADMAQAQGAGHQQAMAERQAAQVQAAA
jgi:hypothetical protein